MLRLINGIGLNSQLILRTFSTSQQSAFFFGPGFSNNYLFHENRFSKDKIKKYKSPLKKPLKKMVKEPTENKGKTNKNKGKTIHDVIGDHVTLIGG